MVENASASASAVRIKKCWSASGGQNQNRKKVLRNRQNVRRRVCAACDDARGGVARQCWN